MQVTMTIPDETYARVQAARRLPTFEKIPSFSGLVRRLVEEGLDRLEKGSGAAPTADGAGATTNPKEIGR